jgi:hypothetical protein
MGMGSDNISAIYVGKLPKLSVDFLRVFYVVRIMFV